MIKDIFLIGILIYVAWQDWKKRSISLRFLLWFGILGVAESILVQRMLRDIFFSCAIGGGLLLLGRLTGGIGEGDGWFFIMLGLWMDWRECLCLLASGLFVCFWISLFLIAGRRKIRREKNASLPFLTCLLPGGIGMFMSELVNL